MARGWWLLVGGAALLVACADQEGAEPRDTPLPPLPTVTTTIAPTTTLPPYYDVQQGDTLDAIAQKVGVSVADLVAANAIADPDRIQVGQRLVVPRLPPAPADPAATTTVAAAPAAAP